MSDTPLTDAAVNAGGNQLLNVAECSRQLERRNAQLLAALRKCSEEHSQQAEAWAKAGEPDQVEYHWKWKDVCEAATR